MFQKILLLAFILFLVGSNLFGQRQKNLLLYSDAIYFASGSDKVTPKYKKALDEIVEALKSHKESRAWIQAHTDSLGSYRDNQALSDRRAASIYGELSKRGIDSSKLKIDSHGEYIPMQSNGTAKGRALNRRVTIEVVRPYVPRDKHRYTCTLSGKVLDAETKNPVATKLIFNSLAGKDSVETDAEGNYEYTTNMETNVEIRAYAKGYFFVAKVGKTQSGDTTEVNFSLEQARLGEKMALKDLYFQGGTPVLLASSEKSLGGLLDFMKFNETLKVEIGGHINKPNRAPVAEDSKSFLLSKARASVVYNYLIENGIDKERLSYKGYGNSEMIHPRASTPVEEQMNRRVEVKIVE